MAPTKPANIRLQTSQKQEFQAMLALLPPHVWLDLYRQIEGTMYYGWQLMECTTFTLGDDQ